MVDVYGIKINREMDKDTFNVLMNMLSIEKINKVNKFKQDTDAQRCLLGDILAKFTICEKFNIDKSQLKYSYNSYGKPTILYPKGIHFNISHSGDWVVCAVDNQPIGIDLEIILPISFKIAKRFFTEIEYNDLMKKNEKDRLDYFYSLWTLKESYIKAIGKGLSIPLNSFSFRIEHDDIKLKTENDYSFFFLETKN